MGEIIEDGKNSPEIGERMVDGTVYAGISPNTHEPMYATPADAPLTHTFNEAAEYVEQLNAQKFLGHDDWRMPTKSELSVLFNSRAAIGGFNETAAYPDGWYWSSSQQDLDSDPWGLRFSDGFHTLGFKISDASLRCVRG